VTQSRGEAGRRGGRERWRGEMRALERGAGSEEAAGERKGKLEGERKEGVERGSEGRIERGNQTGYSSCHKGR